jgi:hypothetical protein
MKRLLKRLTLASGLAAVMAFAYSGVASAAVIPNCVQATNLENIVDDSGSMSSNDTLEGRRQMVEIITDLNRDMTFGGVEFGTDANPLFPPTIASNGHLTPAIFAGLGLIDADNGLTDYNDGFISANAQNPAANARMFLSDGEHNQGAYANGHRNPPRVKTYVVGFGSVDPTILNVIASETGGPFFVVNTSTEVMEKGMEIHAQLNCQTPPIKKVLQFNPNSGGPFALAAKKGKKKKQRGKKVSFAPEGNTAQVVISHGTTGTVLKATGAKQGKKGARKTVTKGDNYVTLNFTGLKKGRVKFNVVPKVLLAPTTATVQILP